MVETLAWTSWEINKAFELGKKIAAVKVDKLNRTPDELYGIGASWAMSFTYISITKALKN